MVANHFPEDFFGSPLLMMEYKGYIGHFSFDAAENIFSGRVANVHHLLTFEGKSIRELQQSFRDTVDEHITWCKKYGKKPEILLPSEE